MRRHIPEGHGPRCRRRAQSLAPCAIAGNHTRCICAAEPLDLAGLTDERRMRDEACAQFSHSVLMRGPAWIAHAAATRVASAPGSRHSSIFHVAVSQHIAHGLVPEVLPDEKPSYSFRHLRISYWNSACVRDCSRAHPRDVN